MNEQEINDIIKKRECTCCKMCYELGYCVYEEDEEDESVFSGQDNR